MRYRLLLSTVAALAALVVALPLLAAKDRTPPRIVAAKMQDTDGNGKADRIEVTFSEPVTFQCDKPARLDSWFVDGYRITGVSPVKNAKTLRILLEEATKPDGDATPKIIYNGHGCKVRDQAGNAAERQEFDKTERFGAATRTVVVTGQFTGKQPGSKLDCNLAQLKIGGASTVAQTVRVSQKSCKATFTKVEVGSTAWASITGTWEPLTPVGGCRDVTIEDGDGRQDITLNLTAGNFTHCLF